MPTRGKTAATWRSSMTCASNLRTHERSNQSQIQRGLKKQKDRVKDALDQLKAAGEAEPIRSGMAVFWRLK